MRNRLPLTSICALAMALGARVSAQDAPPQSNASEHQRLLLKNVAAVGVPGTVGQIALWGDDAFAIVVGADGSTRVPIIAGARLGSGRIIACAHGFASAGAVQQFDTGQFIVNACEWLSGDGGQDGADRPALRIGLLKCDLAAFLRGNGFEVVEMRDGDDLAAQLQQANVRSLLCSESDLSKSQLQAIEQFVRSGRGFLCCTCPWGWAQVRKKDVAELPFNHLLEKAGMAFTDGTADMPRDKGFATDEMPGIEFNATSALEVLAQVEAGRLKPRDPLVAQAGATLRDAAGALPANDQLLRPRLAQLLSDHAASIAPTPDKPLGLNRPLDRALLTLQIADLESLAPEQVRAHPSAAAFPGAVPTDAPRVTRAIPISSAPHGWRSTGLYAAPGEVITLSLNATDLAAATKAGLRVRIGCHRDELWKLDRWQRVPRITRSWPIVEDNMPIASAFGGPIYIEIPRATTFDPIAVTIAGGVEAPLFVLGETSNQQWVSAIRNRPGPWAELACDRVTLSVPSSVARTIDDPTALMEHWVKVLDADADLAGIPHDRVSGGARPERFAADVQISAGYMHSGYPIMTHLDAATFMTDLAKLKEHGWGPYHELGHNHQQGDWTFAGTTEVTCNLFSLYVLETVCHTPPEKSGRVLDDKALTKMRAHLTADGKWQRWKGDPFLALQMYALMQREFGWDAYKKVFAEYRALNKDQRPKNDDEKRDQWLTRFSRAVGRNLGPYFEAWGVPTSAAARASIQDLPVWMPPEMQVELREIEERPRPLRMSADADSKGPFRKPLPRTVVLLGWVSFFADVSSEMIYPLLPMFITGVLGAPAAALGAIEGAAEGLVSVLKAVAGWRSDASGRRVPYVRVGYALPVAGKVIVALANLWPIVLVGRLIDRLGKGIRSSPRDAIIADVVDKSQRGRAFGLHRAMDTAGAVVGVLLAAAMVWWLGTREGQSTSGLLRTTFLIAAGLGMGSVIVTFLVREPEHHVAPNASESGDVVEHSPKPEKFSPRYWLTLGVLMVFALANSSDVFILLRAGDLGLAPWMIVLAYAAYNFTYSALSYPMGALSDRIGRWPVIIVGWLLYAAVYAGFAAAGAKSIWPLLALYGVYMALTEGVGKALVADCAPPQRRATAIGVFYMMLGLATFSSSFVAGLLWDHVSHAAPFWVGSSAALFAAMLALALHRQLAPAANVDGQH